MSEDFLSRWSRRKTEARRAPAVEPPQAEPVLSEEEIAALPKIDTLQVDTDITPFLRAGVPATLRNAALRKMWLLDPAIRDFAGHARDYDYDWNTPGGVPGSGALGPSDDVAVMLRRVLGDAQEAATKVNHLSNETPADKDAAPAAPRGDEYA